MAHRMIPYGYKMTEGRMMTDEKESEIVREVFQRYGNGETLQEIADDLTVRKIVFFQDKCVWDKMMISRMIENGRYKGDDNYPRIVSDGDYEQTHTLKTQKGYKMPLYGAEVEYLKKVTVCAQCGSRIYRHGTWGSRERWICSGGCKIEKYIGDRELIDELSELLKKAKADQSYLLPHNKDDTYRSTTEVIKEINEIKRLTDQADVNFQTVKKMILQCTAKKFVCCTCCDREAYTEHLHRVFSEWDPCNSLDILFWKKITDKITVERDGSITITFINQAEIREGR